MTAVPTQISIVTGNGMMIVNGNMVNLATSGTELISPFALYRLLEDHSLNDQLYPAATVISEGVDVPIGWVPTPNVDPLNMNAVNAFYAQGPRVSGLTRPQFNAPPTQFSAMPSPATFWKQSRPNFYVLTGLGSNQALFPPVQGK